MSNNIRDEFFINYYFNKRIMRVTPNSDTLHQIYASKYAKWIVPFLNQHSITDVPLLLCCNTLYQLPDFFTLGENSFFVTDYYLYCYFYDLNYSLSDKTREEFAINLFIKTFIETLFLDDKIDLCYSLSQTTSGVELYKETTDYNNMITMELLAEKTDLQEMFTLLHEASHFLYNIAKPETDRLISEIKSFRFLETIDLNSEILKELYCDYKSTTFILRTTYQQIKWSKKEYFKVLFLTLIFSYTLQFTRKCSQIDKSEFGNYIDREMKLFWMRFGFMHSCIADFLDLSGNKNAIVILNSTYDECNNLFVKIGQDIRSILRYTRDEGENNLFLFEKVTHTQKKEYIQAFLNLLIS